MAVVPADVVSHLQPRLHGVSLCQLMGWLLYSDLKEEITGAFCQLSGNRDSHKELIACGGIGLLVSSARLSNSSIRMDCAQVGFPSPAPSPAPSLALSLAPSHAPSLALTLALSLAPSLALSLFTLCVPCAPSCSLNPQLTHFHGAVLSPCSRSLPTVSVPGAFAPFPPCLSCPCSTLLLHLPPPPTRPCTTSRAWWATRRCWWRAAWRPA